MSPYHSSGATLLLVEDNPGDAELIADLLDVDLAARPSQITCVVRLSEAVAVLEAGTVDVVLLDLRLPDGFGVECVQTIRHAARAVPIVVLTGIDEQSLALSCISAGAQDYLSKNSISGESLHRAIGYAIARVQERVARRQAEELKKKLELQLLMADRMISIGTLTAGITHEINNPLAAIIANLDLALLDLASLPQGTQISQDLHDELQGAREAAELLRQIVRDLRVFSHPEASSRDVIDVHRVIESSLRIAWADIRYRAQLVKDYGHPPLVWANRSQLGQVILNLIVNAAQAIGAGAEASNEVRIITGTDERGHAFITIADTGCGISDAAQKQLFTPFFTTKPAGSGTGLGLAICHKIMVALGGNISFETQEGVGSRFTVTLPAAPEDILSAQGADPSDGSQDLPQRRRLLVIDEEPLLLKTLHRALSDMHDVVTMRSATDARASIQRGERYDLIICDLSTSADAGMALYGVAQSSPDIDESRFIFLTGGLSPDTRAFLQGVSNPRFEKPFNLLALRRFVEDFLS